MFYCARLGRRVKVSFCGSTCRECSRWRAYDDGERAPAPGVLHPVPCGGATSVRSEREASSFQTAFELFFGVKP